GPRATYVDGQNFLAAPGGGVGAWPRGARARQPAGPVDRLPAPSSAKDFPRLCGSSLSRPALSKAGISGSNIAGRMGKTIDCPRSLPALVWFASVSIIRRTRLLWTREDRMRTNCCKALVAVSALLLSAGIAGAEEVTLIS